jgi:hypothetical protein
MQFHAETRRVGHSISFVLQLMLHWESFPLLSASRPELNQNTLPVLLPPIMYTHTCYLPYFCPLFSLHRIHGVKLEDGYE